MDIKEAFLNELEKLSTRVYGGKHSDEFRKQVFRNLDRGYKKDSGKWAGKKVEDPKLIEEKANARRSPEKAESVSKAV